MFLVNERVIMQDFRNLNYDNEFGGFSSDGSEYWIRQSKKKRIPVAWSNILTNDKFGSVITDKMGGYTWYINSQTNRVTPFDNDSLNVKMVKVTEKLNTIRKLKKSRKLKMKKNIFILALALGMLNILKILIMYKKK